MKASPNSDCVFVCNYVFISGHPFLPISTCIENYHSHKHDRKVFYLAASLSGASSIFSSDTFPFSTFPTESNADRFPLLATAPLKGTSSPLSSCSFTLGVLISPSRSHVCTWRTWHGCTHPASLLEIGNLGSADDHDNFGHKGDDGDDDLIFHDDYDHCENWHFTAHLRVCYKPQTRCGIFHLVVIIMIIDRHKRLINTPQG